MVRRVPRFVSPSGPTLTERKSRPCVHRVWLPFSKGSVPCAHPDAEDRARPSTSKRPGPGRTRLFWLCPAQRLSPQSRPGILLGKLQVAKGKPGKGRGAGTRHTAPLRPLRKGRHVAGVTKSEKGAQDMISRQTPTPKVGRSAVTVLTFHLSKFLLTIYLHFKSLQVIRAKIVPKSHYQPFGYSL